jgi:hypothetical protein
VHVSVPGGNMANYVHAPRGLVERQMKAGGRSSRASAFKLKGSV